MTRRAPSLALQVEQLEDRLTPAGSVIPAGEFNWMQYSPTGELGELVWNGSTLVYQSRINGAWQATNIASIPDFTASSYDTRAAVETASRTAQLVFTSDGTPHALVLEKEWNGTVGQYQTVIVDFARTTAGWQQVESILPPWTSQWGPNNLVAVAGANNAIDLLFTETSVAATGVGSFGNGQLYYATNASGSWNFSLIANTADLSQDVWFTGGRWEPRFLDLAVDAQNHAYVTYTPEFYIAGAFSTVQSTLMYASNVSGSWQSQAVMSPNGDADAGLGASIAVSPTGQVAIANYYVQRYSTGSPQYSELVYHTLVNGIWTSTMVANTPDGYVAGDGAKFTGFAPQLFFDSAGRPNIIFSDEAGQHLPVSYANEFAGQIRLATLNGSSWSLQTVYKQTDPLHNQLFYPVAATYNGQITFAGLQAVSTLDSNNNPTRTDFTIIGVNTPNGLSAIPPSALQAVPPPPPAPVSSSTSGVPSQSTSASTAVGGAVALDAGTSPSEVVVYRPDGTVAMTVTPFGNNYTGGVRFAMADINGDGVPDLITLSEAGIESRIRIWDGKTAQMIADIVPFPGYLGGLYVAAGDVNADGIADIAVGTDLGNSPHVKVYDGRTLSELASFYAYEQGFLGGVQVAMGDITHNGYADLVTAPGYGAGADIAIFDGRTLRPGVTPQKLFGDFYMYDPAMTAGINLAVGDVYGNGYADIIAGPRVGPAHLRIVSGAALAAGDGPVFTTSMILWPGDTGLRVAAVDAYGDGRTEVMVAPSGADNGQIAIISQQQLLTNNPSGAQWLDPLPGLTTGVWVG